MGAPTSADLATLLARPVSQEQGDAVIGIVTSMAAAYTRDMGFIAGVPNSAIRSVILTASARLLSNARGLLIDEAKGPESVSYRSAFTGWTLAERLTLDRYRKKAC